MKPAGIHHVNLLVSDLEPALRFYTDALGLVPLDRPPFDFEGAWLAAGDQQVHLVVTPDLPSESTQHFALLVDDLESVVAELRSEGLRVSSPQAIADIAQQSFLRDPSGNLIELHQRN